MNIGLLQIVKDLCERNGAVFDFAGYIKDHGLPEHDAGDVFHNMEKLFGAPSRVETVEYSDEAKKKFVDQLNAEFMAHWEAGVLKWNPLQIDKFVAEAITLFFPTFRFSIDVTGTLNPVKSFRAVKDDNGRVLFGYDCAEFESVTWPELLTAICDRLKACEFDQQQIESQLLMVARCRFPSGIPVPPAPASHGPSPASDAAGCTPP